MADVRIRRQIALLAARLMYDREEKEYFTAKRKAAPTKRKASKSKAKSRRTSR